jgi:hypothetical protein
MGAGWNMLRFASLPTEHTFGIAFGIDVPWDETNQPHELSLEVQDPDGERLGDEFSLEFETGRPPGTVPGQEQRIALSLTSLITFETQGPHAVVLRLGEDEIGRSRFYVLEAAEMAQS